jgi:hypothetical protein
MRKIGDKLTIEGIPYQIVGVWRNGNLEKGLLNLQNFCVGMTDFDIEVVIRCYEEQ